MANHATDKECGIPNVVHEDNVAQDELRQAQQTRTAEDDLPIWQAVQRYKLVTVVAMLAAFSASLDGYRKDCMSSGFRSLTLMAEISLNGGIVSNKGFIKQFAAAGTTVIDGKYVSAWGGIQSTGQTLGQIVSKVSRQPENLLT